MVWSSHCFVGLSIVMWSGVHIVSWGCREWCGLEFTLFSGVVCSWHCSVGWSGVHIVQLDGLEFILFSGMVWSSHCSVGWSGVHIVQWGSLKFTLFSEVVWSLYCCVKDRAGVWTEDIKWSVEDSWSGWVWGPRVIYRLEIRSWAWNLEEKYVQQIAKVFDKI